MIGSTLSHFKITAKLGEGGMGVVYLAEDTDLHRPVALKVLSSEVMEREDMRARFMREARTAAALNHPNVCTIYEVGEVDQVPFIAMELIKGTGLDERLSAGELSLPELTRVGLRVAEGLAAAHAAGIVHRDLKPGNVMLTDDGHVKILDFGLAKPQGPMMGEGSDEMLAQTITAEMTQEGTILGTVSYMSPEQAEGKEVDSRSDVFAFGVLLYQMATRQLPFKGDTATSTLAKILEAEPEPVSTVRQGLPADLERVIRRCLQKRPEHRYNDSRDLVAEMRDLQTTGEEQALSGARTVAPALEPTPVPGAATPPPPTAPVEAPRKRPAWMGIAMIGALAMVAIFLIRPLNQKSDEPEAEVAVAAVEEVPSVAVLPFHNLSADEENTYFSAGMTEEIISKLSRIEGLEVASRSSVASYIDAARDVQQIGTELGVRYLLDGTVRRAGDQVRVSAQLVDGSTGRNVWSEEFEGSLEDVFAMQEETALKIADRLDLELSPDEQRGVKDRPTESVEAYDAYLQAMSMSREWGNRAILEKAIERFELALEHDPDFAAALAGLAFVESDMYRNFDSSEQRIKRAEDLATRAAALDPTMADASHALALVAGNRYDYDRAAELLRETVRLEPKEPRFWDNLSWALAYQIPPDADGAVEAAREALRLQPIFPGAYYHLGRGLILQGNHEAARQAFEMSLEQDPDFDSGHLGLAQHYLAVGEYEAGLAALDKSGDKATAITLYYSAALHASAGKADLALENLKGAMKLGFRDFTVLEASPYFESLRSDPRYQELVDKYQD